MVLEKECLDQDNSRRRHSSRQLSGPRECVAMPPRVLTHDTLFAVVTVLDDCLRPLPAVLPLEAPLIPTPHNLTCSASASLYGDPVSNWVTCA